MTLKLIDIEFGLSAARDRGERPPNGVQLLADRTGIPRRTLSEAVHGRDQVADYRIVLIARALNVRPGVLKAGDDEDEKAEPEKVEPKRETVGPPRRTNGKGPKRAKAAA